MERGGDLLSGHPTSGLMCEKHHGYILYPLSETGPLGRLHACRGVGDGSMQVPILALGTGYSRSFLRGAVSALQALEEMGWMPVFVGSRVWRFVKWTTSQAVVHPYAGLQELKAFAMAVLAGHTRWYTAWPYY